MKIVYCGSFRLPCYDAAAPRVLNNGRAFVKAGHEVTFISWGGKYRESDKCADGKYRVDDMVYFITNEVDAIGFLRKCQSIINRGNKTIALLEAFEYKPDVVVLYNADWKWTIKIIKYCSERGIKIVNDITEWYDNKELHFYEWIPNWFNMNFTQHRISNKIVISSFLDKFYKNSNNIIVPPLCNPSEKKWSEEIPDSIIPKYEGISLIYAGTPAKKDCLHTVINVVNKLAVEGEHIRFIILGIDRDVYIKSYTSQVSTKELQSNIFFMGRVSQDLIPAYYKKADFMVLLREPNRKSIAGFPTKFAESITAGVPVISNNTSDLGLYIRDGETGFLLDNNGENCLYTVLKHKVLKLSNNEICDMKKNVSALQSSFSYSAYINLFKSFLSNLR